MYGMLRLKGGVCAHYCMQNKRTPGVCIYVNAQGDCLSARFVTQSCLATTPLTTSRPGELGEQKLRTSAHPQLTVVLHESETFKSIGNEYVVVSGLDKPPNQTHVFGDG